MTNTLTVGKDVTLKYDTKRRHAELYSDNGTLWPDWTRYIKTDKLWIKSIHVAEGTVFLPEDSSYCFCGLTELRTLDLSNFDTSGVINMHNMFYNCPNLIDLNLSGFDTSNVTNMHEMFGRCLGLKHLDLRNFNTSNVIDMSWMFCNCTNLTELDLSSFDTSRVTDMKSMFEGCGRLTSLDLRGFNTSKVTFMTKMFAECGNMRQIVMNPIVNKETGTCEIFQDCNAEVIWEGR